MDKATMQKLLSKELLTVQEVGSILDVADITVGKYIRSGRVRALNVSAGKGKATWRIWSDSVKEFMGISDASRENVSPPMTV